LAICGWILPFDQTPPVPKVTGSALASASWGYECTQGHYRPGGESGFASHRAAAVFRRRRFELHLPYRSLVSLLSDCKKEIAAGAVAALRPFVRPDDPEFFKSSNWPKPTIEK